MTNGYPFPGRRAAQSAQPALRYTAFQRSLGRGFAGAICGAMLGAVFPWFALPFDGLMQYLPRFGTSLPDWHLLSWTYGALGAVLGVIIEVPRGLARDTRRLRRLAEWRAIAPIIGADPAARQDEREMVEACATLVTRAHAEAFARQPPPRRIPGNIRRYAERFAPQLFVVMGTLFVLAGTIIALGLGLRAISSGKGLWNSDWFGVPFGLFFIAFGSPMVFYFGRSRYRIWRLLRKGRMTTARIEKVAATDESVNDVAIALLTVVYRHEGREVRASCKIIGPGKQRAEKLAADRKPAAILYHPAVPQRILFVDDLITVGTNLGS